MRQQSDPEPCKSNLDAGLVLYRLTRRKYAGLSGMGAALYPGRWNRLGQEVIYTSVHQATAILECLVHLDKALLPTNLVMMHIRCNRNITATTFRDVSAAESSFKAGRFENLDVVAIPSIVAPAEWNVVIYPGTPLTASSFSIQKIESFDYDPRLFPESAALQP